MPDIEVKTKDLKEIELTGDLYAQAADLGMTLSQLLEQMSPTDPKDNLDAFERLLKRQKINIHGDPKAGIPAGRGSLFLTSNDNRVLFPEFLNRAARVAMVDTATAQLSDLVSSVENVESGAIIRNLYIDQTSAQKKKKDVAEGAEIPKTKITWSDKTARGSKKGIGLVWSYEFIQQVSLPVLQTAIAGIVLQNSIDDIAEAIRVLQEGDGTSKEGGAISDTNLSTYQSGTTAAYSDLTYEGWIEFLLNMLPYSPSTVVTTKKGYAALMNMQTPSNTMPMWLYELTAAIAASRVGAAPVPAANLRIPNPIVTVHGDISNNKHLIVDKRFAMQAYTYAGMDLSETQRVISRQVEEMYITNVIFFSCIFRDAVLRLNCAA